MRFDFFKRGPKNLLGHHPAIFAVPLYCLLQFGVVFPLSIAIQSQPFAFALGFFNFSILYFALWWPSYRLRRAVKLSDGRMCVYCRYSLKELPSPGPCPECGHEFPADGYASLWEPYTTGRRGRLW